MSHGLLTEVIPTFSGEQRKWVIDRRFRTLLLFNIKNYLDDLCLFLVKSNDPDATNMVFENHIFQISEALYIGSLDCQEEYIKRNALDLNCEK